jgi:GT2 family glycosyltransferase
VIASFVVVTWNSRSAVEHALPALLAQLRDDDEVIVVDNASRDRTAAFVRERWPACRVIETGANLGFAAGCNRGAAAASGELLVFINPDAAPAPGFRDALEDVPADWDAWMPLVTMDHGELVNTSGGVVHFTGISWAGQAGTPANEVGLRPSEVGFVSGACFAVRRAVWDRHGGFAEPFFMYCEDLDLSLRIRLAGGRIGLQPAARVEHDYEFAKRPEKWRLLERNRIATVIRTYPGALLAVALPAMLATELALIPIAFASGWGRQKLLALADTLRWLPRLLRERRAVQSQRVISASTFAHHLTSELSSPYLGRPAKWPVLQGILRGYWAAARRLLPR